MTLSQCLSTSLLCHVLTLHMQQCSASSYYTCPAERGYEPMRCTVASDCARAWSGSSDNSQKLCLVMMPGNTTNATCDVRIAGERPGMATVPHAPNILCTPPYTLSDCMVVSGL